MGEDWILIFPEGNSSRAAKNGTRMTSLRRPRVAKALAVAQASRRQARKKTDGTDLMIYP